MHEIIYCTYIGGSDYDAIISIDLDKEGNLYAVGFTQSSDFPYTKNAYDTSYNGTVDVFILKMNSKGKLQYLSFFGGSGIEHPSSLIIDDSLNIYITGFTNSSNFPVKSAYSNSYNGGNEDDLYGGDAFVTKFNISDNTLLFSTYLGGSENELCSGLSIDKEYNVYITGSTNSADFPVKNGFDSIYGGNTDGFISKLNNSGDQLIYSSYFGGTKLDDLSDIKVNNKNEAYFCGGTASSGLNCSENAFYKNLCGEEDIVIGKVDASGKILEYVSYFGGKKIELGKWGVSKLHLNNNSTLIIVGNTLSNDFPVTNDAFQRTYGGPGDWDQGDLFISYLDINKKDNLYTTYFGGNKGDGIHLGIQCLNDSIVYIGSFSASNNFYTSSDALFKNYCGGVADACIIKMTFSLNKTSIPEISYNNEIEIFPNPASGQLILSFNKIITSKVIVEIYNSKGKQIFLKSGCSSTDIFVDLSNFQDGIYIVKAIADKKVYHQKIIKN